MSPRLLKAEVLDNYIFQLTFTNGEQGKFDLKPFLNTGKFKQLYDINNLRRFYLDDGVITWYNGLDISPDTIYQLKYN
mgnify:CR=1 FL=1